VEAIPTAAARILTEDLELGTMSIIQSCVLTLVACIYTALHLNVPSKKGLWNNLLVKIRWVLLALLAPEIVLYIAAVQFTQAVKLRDLLNELRKKKPGSEDVSQPSIPWGYEHPIRRWSLLLTES
jgi:hypothetical protein